MVERAFSRPSKPTENKEESEKPKREEIAVAWLKVTSKGDEYLSVKIKTKHLDMNKDEINFPMFENSNKKTGSSAPDYIAYKRD